MADTSYSPAIYKKQGGAQLVVAAGGSIVLEGPGAIDASGLVPSTETTGSFLTTGSTWVAHSAVGGCFGKILAKSTAASGDFHTWRIRARADGAGNCSGLNSSASANVANYGDLKGVEGLGQPNANAQTNAANIVCGVYARTDMTASGSSGRDWPLWVDTHAAAQAAGGAYLARFSHNGTANYDGCFTIYNGGRMAVLFNFEDAAGFLTETGSAGSTAAGYLAVQTPAGTKYINLVTA